MTTKTRKKHRGTPDADVDGFLASMEPPPEPPPYVKLRPEDRSFWDALVMSRASRDWMGAELCVLAQLARCQADIEKVTERLYKEDYVRMSNRGTPIMNPLVTVLEGLARRELALFRLLQIGGSITGDRRDLLVRKQTDDIAKQVRREAAEEDPEELLAR